MSTESRMKQYVLAATVAGVGTLALAPAAQAGIVYTQVNQSFAPGHMANFFGFDDNAVFSIDNELRTNGFFTTYARVVAFYNTVTHPWFSKALSAEPGYDCKPAVPFAPGQLVDVGACRSNSMVMAAASTTGNGPNLYAAPFQGDGLFVGFTFFNWYESHDYFGWVRVNVHSSGMTQSLDVIDWAYETSPDTPIAAGDTGSAAPEPGSLGLLAIGAAGLAAVRARRRRKAANL